jgi:gluconolactonase
VVSKNGSIYFTDPIYGLEKGANDPLRELKFEGVYKVDSSGKTSLLIDSISRPNGIVLK